MIGHSPAAALVDACECAQCKRRRSKPEDWYFFTIRSKDVHALKQHREEMRVAGWHVGPIKVADQWSGHSGKFTFVAKSPKAAVTEEELQRLVAWDLSQGE